MMKRFFLGLFISTVIMGNIAAHYTHYPFSQQWQEAEKLQAALTEKYGVEKPFSDYLATVYTLLVMQEKLHRQWFANKDDKVKQVLTCTEDLLVNLEQISHAYLADTQAPPRDGEQPAVSSDVATTFYSVLQASQRFLDEYTPHYLDALKPRDQGQMVTLIPQPTWPPSYPWPPQGPYPQQAAAQQPAPPEKEPSKWETIAKVAGVVGVTGFVYYVFKKYMESDLMKKNDALTKLVTENEKLANDKLAELEKKQGRVDTFVQDYEAKLTEAQKKLAIAEERWASTCKDIQATYTQLNTMKKSCDEALQKINDQMVERVKEMNKVKETIAATITNANKPLAQQAGALNTNLAKLETLHKGLLEKYPHVQQAVQAFNDKVQKLITETNDLVTEIMQHHKTDQRDKLSERLKKHKERRIEEMRKEHRELLTKINRIL